MLRTQDELVAIGEDFELPNHILIFEEISKQIERQPRPLSLTFARLHSHRPAVLEKGVVPPPAPAPKLPPSPPRLPPKHAPVEAPVPAEHAAMGLVDEVVPSQDVQDRARVMADALRLKDMHLFAAIKRTFNDAPLMTDAQLEARTLSDMQDYLSRAETAAARERFLQRKARQTHD